MWLEACEWSCVISVWGRQDAVVSLVEDCIEPAPEVSAAPRSHSWLHCLRQNPHICALQYRQRVRSKKHCALIRDARCRLRPLTCLPSTEHTTFYMRTASISGQSVFDLIASSRTRYPFCQATQSRKCLKYRVCAYKIKWSYNFFKGC